MPRMSRRSDFTSTRAPFLRCTIGMLIGRGLRALGAWYIWEPTSPRCSQAAPASSQYMVAAHVSGLTAFIVRLPSNRVPYRNKRPWRRMRGEVSHRICPRAQSLCLPRFPSAPIPTTYTTAPHPHRTSTCSRSTTRQLKRLMRSSNLNLCVPQTGHMRAYDHMFCSGWYLLPGLLFAKMTQHRSSCATSLSFWAHLRSSSSSRHCYRTTRQTFSTFKSAASSNLFRPIQPRQRRAWCNSS